MSIILIVAVDGSFGIGYKNDLLFKIPEDMKRFKELTQGNIVMMGRKTYESLPKTLPNRTNIVMTRNTQYKPIDPSVMVVHSVEKAINQYRNSGSQDKDLFIIGGAEVYKQFLPYADKLYLTFIHKIAKNVDTYFPIDVARELGLTVSTSYEIYSEEEDCEVTFVDYIK